MPRHNCMIAAKFWISSYIWPVFFQEGWTPTRISCSPWWPKLTCSSTFLSEEAFAQFQELIVLLHETMFVQDNDIWSYPRKGVNSCTAASYKFLLVYWCSTSCAWGCSTRLTPLNIYHTPWFVLLILSLLWLKLSLSIFLHPAVIVLQSDGARISLNCINRNGCSPSMNFCCLLTSVATSSGA